MEIYSTIVYKGVKREWFEQLSQLAGPGTKYFKPITIFYNGTNIGGSVQIKAYGEDDQELFNEFVKIVEEVIAGTYKEDYKD